MKVVCPLVLLTLHSKGHRGPHKCTQGVKQIIRTLVNGMLEFQTWPRKIAISRDMLSVKERKSCKL